MMYGHETTDDAPLSSHDEKLTYSTFENGRALPVHEDDELHSATARQMAYSRRNRNVLVTLLLVAALAAWIFKWYFILHINDSGFRQGFLKTAENDYSVAKGAHFDGVRVQDLHPDLIPGGDTDPHGKRRLIFVGDIHGCANELKKLLKRVEFNEETDHLIAVGDVISKGPDNVGVLDELIRLHASSVRGNHEDRILDIAPSVLDSSDPHTLDETTQAVNDAELLRQLSKHHLEYLHDMPLVLRIPALPQAKSPSYKDDSRLAEEILVVHAGLVPAVPLEKQDPYFVMNMRAIVTKTHMPIAEAEAKGKSRPWREFWRWYNDRIYKGRSLKDFQVWEDPSPSEERSTTGWLDRLTRWSSASNRRKYPDPQIVIYGHRSKEGLQIHRWTKGLDTGCVKGEKLTALVLDAKGQQEIVQVGCDEHI